MPIVIEPDYYKDFHCIADACRTSCCKGWRIDISRRSYNKLRSTRMDPELRTLVDTGISRRKNSDNPKIYAGIDLNEADECPFLDENKLCRLQRACGPGILPDVCRSFPRNCRIYKDKAFRSCSTACEEVVHLLWLRPLGLKFHRATEQALRGTLLRPVEGVRHLFDRLEDIRKLAIDILQNRAYSLDGRVILLGLAAGSLAQIEPVESDEAVAAWLEKYRGFAHGGGFQNALKSLPSNQFLFLSNNAYTIDFLSLLSTAGHRSLLHRILDNLGIRREELRYTFDTARYAALKQRMEAVCDDYLLENIMVNECFSGPFPLNADTVWDSYMQFCITYSLLKFLLTGAMTEDAKEDDVVDTVVLWSRILLHNGERLKGMTKEFHDNESDTLAHMAVLVNG